MRKFLEGKHLSRNAISRLARTPLSARCYNFSISEREAGTGKEINLVFDSAPIDTSASDAFDGETCRQYFTELF
jgi:hypothetical protein